MTFKEAAEAFAESTDAAYEDGASGNPAAMLKANTLLALAPALDAPVADEDQVDFRKVAVDAYAVNLDAWMEIVR